KGVPTGPVKKVKKIDKSEHGTTQHWMPDGTIFDTLDYHYATLAQRFREMAYLTAGLRITFTDERADLENTFYFEGGITSFVRHLNKTKTPLHPRPFYMKRDVGDYIVEVA